MKFRKKPVVITAEQWDGTPENAQCLIEWVCQEGHLDATFVQDSVKTVICIPTPESLVPVPGKPEQP